MERPKPTGKTIYSLFAGWRECACVAYSSSWYAGKLDEIVQVNRLVNQSALYPPRHHALQTTMASSSQTQIYQTRHDGPAKNILSCTAFGGREFIENQPIQSQLLHRFVELIEIYRLADIAVGAQFIALYEVLVFL